MLGKFILLFVVSISTSYPLFPGDSAPAFRIQTLDGFYSYDPSTATNPLLIYAYNEESGFCVCLWTKPESIDDLLELSPANAEYLFFSYSPDSRSAIDAHMFRVLFFDRVNALQKNVSDWERRTHFAVKGIPSLDNWIPDLLKNWTREIDQMVIETSPPNISPRLDARFDWLPPIASLGASPLPIVNYSDPCESTSLNMSGNLVLIPRQSATNCSLFQKIKNAQKSGAIGIVVYSSRDLPLVDMNCEGSECDEVIDIPATMIPFSYGMELMELILRNKTFSVQFQSVDTSGYYAAIDSSARVQEMGWLKYPTSDVFDFLSDFPVAFFAWQAQYLNYTADLEKKITSEKPLSIPIFTKASLYKDPISSVVKIPSAEDLLSYAKVEIELFLDCEGGYDTLCPIWDRVVLLDVCCEGNPYCGRELGRWITPFRRRVGHWVTDMTTLSPLLFGSSCNFTLHTDRYILKPWMPSLNLLLSGTRTKISHSPTDLSTSLIPWEPQVPLFPKSILPLFEGGTFNQSYNSKYHPITFNLNNALIEKVYLVAVITGHGSDNNNCGEFCPTSHHFIINGNANVRNFTEAGTAMGCTLQVQMGSVPNEHGTWLYGRDGWCDGQNVAPWIVDVTDQIHFQGSNTVSYFGWFQGHTPDPTSHPGVIIMSSQLAFFWKQ